MSDAVVTRRFTAPDGVVLAWHETGRGRPVLLIHGLFSNSEVNWIRFGHASAIAARGFRVIMADLRAHGDSEAPHDPRLYSPDILARDGLGLIAHLGLEDYDLGGYSLGARTSVRMHALGARPRRMIIAGMGLDGMVATGRRASHFRRILTNLGSHERGSPEWLAEAFLKTTGGDPQALLPLLASFVDTSETELAAIACPTLVVSGADDDDNGSPSALARALAEGLHVEVPGNHMSAVTKADLGRAMADFLAS